MEAKITELHFCHKWFLASACMIEPIASEAALARHRESIGYTVVVGDLKRPHCFLEVGSTCLVCYFDELRRTPDTYDFIEIKEHSGSFFLACVIQREFEAESTKVIRALSYSFSCDGKVRVIESAIPTGEHRITDTSADVGDYFVKKPAFGEYDEFIRKRKIKLKS